ncbi:MAG: excinuclease ABC subunit UvrA [Armatimonadetes bacterium]|nr:excinuclease ABC subunit UvrA [Armatimonadota bacterium]
MDTLSVFGARAHNLKDVTVHIPRGKLVVFSGVSGSGKSSLAFDTIYAEGQRRYVESLSAYARQFLDRMARPEVDHIEGLSPAISIEQKAASGNPRSTVATVTEISDYLRVLYARVGKVHCHQCGRPITSQTAEQIVDRLLELPEGTRLLVLAPVAKERRGSYKDILGDAVRQGYVRARIDGEVVDLSGKVRLTEKQRHTVEIVVDRLVMRHDGRSRLNDSVETALALGDQTLVAAILEGEDLLFSSRFACVDCGISYPPLTPAMFSFNSPQGMCTACGGLGTRLSIDPEALVADASKPVLGGALDLQGKEQTPHSRHVVEALGRHYGFEVDTPWRDLPEEARRALLEGTGDASLEFTYKARSGREFSYTSTWEGFFSPTRDGRDGGRYSAVCSKCRGTRIRGDVLGVQVGGKSVVEFLAMTVEEAERFCRELDLGRAQAAIASRLVTEIASRLRFMADVGLEYLTLDRASPSLSGGEAQRIRLATQIGAGLTGVLYVLDEPSIGLHARDHSRLLRTLAHLRDLGNTVIVVEHDAETILSADHVVDFGPGAGVHGGEIVHEGTVEELLASPASLTGAYLSGRKRIETPAVRRKVSPEAALEILGAEEHNLRQLDVRVPLGVLTCVTGVSGSGKSTLIIDILYRALQRRLYNSTARPGRHRALRGVEHIEKVVNIDQDPIGRTPRSNPATYVGAFNLIRELFAATPEARMRGYEPGRFSFNVRGGRCDSCDGDGTIRVEMHFLPDVYVTCEACRGTRYNRETLQVLYKGRSIAQVLDLTVAEALELFGNLPRVRRILETLAAVGLDYIHLGQPAPTLSGGEAQRVKLAKELARTQSGKTLYVLDEPTTGLHFDDIRKLLSVLNRLVDAGNTVVVIEHNLDVIKCADYVIDLGPEGGAGGGRLVAGGTPEEVARTAGSHTGAYLAQALHPGSRL